LRSPDQRRRCARAPPAREARSRFRAEAASDPPWRGLRAGGRCRPLMKPDTLRRRVAETLGFRLAIYYALIFVASVLTISAFAYLLLERSLVERDHELIRVKLADYTGRYETAGLSGLTDAVGAEQASGTDD